jgi:hypothetical protein
MTTDITTRWLDLIARLQQASDEVKRLERERAELLREAWEGGQSLRAIARVVGLSHARVGQLIDHVRDPS